MFVLSMTGFRPNNVQPVVLVTRTPPQIQFRRRAPFNGMTVPVQQATSQPLCRSGLGPTQKELLPRLGTRERSLPKGSGYLPVLPHEAGNDPLGEEFFTRLREAGLRVWLLINHGRNARVCCRRSNQWLEPAIGRVDFDALIAIPDGTIHLSLE